MKSHIMKVPTGNVERYITYINNKQHIDIKYYELHFHKIAI